MLNMEELQFSAVPTFVQCRYLLYRTWKDKYLFWRLRSLQQRPRKGRFVWREAPAPHAQVSMQAMPPSHSGRRCCPATAPRLHGLHGGVATREKKKEDEIQMGWQPLPTQAGGLPVPRGKRYGRN